MDRCEQGYPRKTSCVWIQVFDPDQLALLKEPVRAENESLGGRNILVPAVALYRRDQTSSPSINAILQQQMIEQMLLRAVRHQRSPRSWDNLVSEWDMKVATALNDRSSHFSGAFSGTAVSGQTAMQWFQQLTALNALAKDVFADVGKAFTLAQGLDRSHDTPEEFDKLVAEIAGFLNDARLGADTGNSEHFSVEGFATEFQRYRGRVLNFLKRLSKELAEAELSDEKRYFDEEVSTALEADVEIILLGAFSSGKSTLINSLLGFTQQNELLKTGAKPVTASITVLKYSPKAYARARFLDPVDITLFQMPVHAFQPGRWQVHALAINSLLNWVDAKAFSKNGLIVESFDRSGVMPDAILPKDLEFLRTIRSQMTAFCDETKLAEEKTLRRISGIRFHSKPKMPAESDVDAFLEAATDPDIVLRLRSLHIGLPQDALEGLNFVDTPGTDSMVSHHALQAKRSPTIGRRAAGRAPLDLSRQQYELLQAATIGSRRQNCP